MAEKEFGKLTCQQWREFYSLYHGVGLDKKRVGRTL
jgi:hypothetical protein